MRFKANLRPKEGDKRTVMRFAWFPVVRERDNQSAWLEIYYEDQVFHEDNDFSFAGRISGWYTEEIYFQDDATIPRF